LKGEDYTEDLSIDGRVILKLNLLKIYLEKLNCNCGPILCGTLDTEVTTLSSCT
jgi:hypothetical protein